MAKNIDFMGAVFPDVPSIRLPQYGGGLASFDDTTDADATAADIASGKTAYVNGVKLTGTASGGGGSGLVYETGTYTPTSDIARPTINFTGTHTTPPFYAMIYDATGTAYTTANSNKMFEITTFYYMDSGSLSALVYYGRTSYLCRGSNGNTSSGANLSSISDSGTSGVGYYVSNTYLKPYTASDSRYWRLGRTYKWIAVWAPTS